MNLILLLLSLFFGIVFLLKFKKPEYLGTIVLISRLFLALVFLYSGFVKAVDPLGYTYKIVDYFVAFGFPPMDKLAFVLAIFFSTVEFIIGFGFLSGSFLKFNSKVAALFMIIFTPLTLILALTNPVTDCGCFGDALVISNWQTFWKNIIIDIPLIILLLERKNIRNILSAKSAFILNLMAASSIVYISIYSYQHLPILDFRPFKVGENIAKGMEMPKDAKEDVYKTSFTYKNIDTGELVKFDENNLDEAVNNEAKWKYVDSQSELIEKGYHPPIHDFTIENNELGDITKQVLSDSSYTLILISYDLMHADKDALIQFADLSKKLKTTSIKTLALTAALDDQITEIKKILLDIDSLTIKAQESEKEMIYFYQYEGNILEFNEDEIPDNLDDSYVFVGSEETESKTNETRILAFDFFICDPTTLKTIVRSNPGLVLLKQGTIIQKWHYNDSPKVEEIKKYEK